MKRIVIIGFSIAALISVAFVAGRYFAMNANEVIAAPNESSSMQEKQPLYWYDPMYPQQHFDKPGKSPFMEMELVPKFADEVSSGNGVKIDAQMQQNLGVRLAAVMRQTVTPEMLVSATLQFNQRDVSIVQTRIAGFVTAAAKLAPGDHVQRGQTLLKFRAPEWTAAMQEWLVLQSNVDGDLRLSATQRLLQLGLAESDITQLQKTSKATSEFTLTASQSGVIETLDARNGMTLMPGQTIAKITADDSLWLDISVPQKYAAYVDIGQTVDAKFVAQLDHIICGQIKRILPALDERNGSVRVQVELPNHGGKLRAGMVAQVHLHGREHEALVVPTEAVIRSGKRSMVIVSNAESFMPVMVELGAEYGDMTEIVSGVDEDQQVVRSGQFLIDSEANLSGVVAKLTQAESDHD